MNQFVYNDFKAKIKLQPGVTNTGRNINSGSAVDRILAGPDWKIATSNHNK